MKEPERFVDIDYKDVIKVRFDRKERQVAFITRQGLNFHVKAEKLVDPEVRAYIIFNQAKELKGPVTVYEIEEGDRREISKTGKIFFNDDFPKYVIGITIGNRGYYTEVAALKERGLIIKSPIRIPFINKIDQIDTKGWKIINDEDKEISIDELALSIAEATLRED